MHLLAILVLVLLAACGDRAAPVAESVEVPPNMLLARESRLLDKGSGKLAPGDAAPDFSYTLPDGTTQRLSDFQGLPVVLNFWATWCLPCIEEMPELEGVFSEGELYVIAVNRNELPDAIARFAPKVNVSFPLVANIDGSIADRYRVNNLPTTYFINRDGTIGAIQIGALNEELLRERLQVIQ